MNTVKGMARRWNIHEVLCAGLLAMVSVNPAQAATVHYTLDNVIQDDGQQMTGSFTWTYVEGDFENGSGLFNDLFIPGYGTDIDALTINFDIANSIEFSLTANIDNGGVNVALFLLQPLTPSTPALLDPGRSTYEIEIGARRGGFVSGSIVAGAVPIPAAAWLFGSGLIGLAGMMRHRKTACSLQGK